jgi:hypothetical protein
VHVIDSAHLNIRPVVNTAYTMIAEGECNRRDTVSFTVSHATSYVTFDTIIPCWGNTVWVGDKLFSYSHSDTVHFKSMYGCDSLVNVTVNIRPRIATIYSRRACYRDTIIFGGDTFTTDTSIIKTFTSVTGCDSSVITNITFFPYYYYPVYLYLCRGQSITIHGQVFYTDTMIIDTLFSVGGCDSLVDSIVRFLPYIFKPVTQYLCLGGTLMWRGRPYSQPYSHDGYYLDTAHVAGGCDTIWQLHLISTAPALNYLPAAICSRDSFYYGGHYYSRPGLYYDTLMNSVGCDSVEVLALSTYDFFFTYDTLGLCPGSTLVVGDHIHDTSGDYIDTVHAQGGCDSVIFLHVKMLESGPVLLNQYLCSGDTLVY